MIYIEMSRDQEHGGGGWSFPNCLWAPILKKNGANWPFWKKILDVREGDIVLHLRGEKPNAHFVGFSTASSNVFETSARPPNPKDWGFADRFFRANLADFRQFHQPIELDGILQRRNTQLRDFFSTNRVGGSEKLNLFFVLQSGRLQCQNGAYLSDASEDLLDALFGQHLSDLDPNFGTTNDAVETGSQLRLIKARLGQNRFSHAIKSLYSEHCCFPGCSQSDVRFLIASHIARWSDNEGLRGDLANGLCLCGFHDKAFELGLFTLDDQLRIFVAGEEKIANSETYSLLMPYHGTRIRTAAVLPSDAALLEHWIRVGLDPIGSPSQNPLELV